jgi:hypothetical protein
MSQKAFVGVYRRSREELSWVATLPVTPSSSTLLSFRGRPKRLQHVATKNLVSDVGEHNEISFVAPNDQLVIFPFHEGIYAAALVFAIRRDA